MMTPRPRQAGQGLICWTTTPPLPCRRTSWPLPLHLSQLLGCVPAFVPVPLQLQNPVGEPAATAALNFGYATTAQFFEAIAPVLPLPNLSKLIISAAIEKSRGLR